MRLPKEFQTAMQARLGEAYPVYLAAMERPPRRGLRVNTLKLSVEEFLRIAPWALAPAQTAPEGLLPARAADAAGIGAHPLHRAGLFYMQEPSAMRAAALLEVRPGMRVLDVCAAPGGKAGQLAAMLQGKGLLLANEVERGRAAILRGNLERLGVRNALIANMRPEALAKELPGYFDAVLVDAPCSGEGMFRKEPQAVVDWSPAHVRACALRQAGILDSAAALLRPGGRLAYATCTFSEEENERTVEGLLLRHPTFTLLAQERHYPHTGLGEGQYIALLQKAGAGERQEEPPAARTGRLPKDAGAAWASFMEQVFRTPPAGRPLLLPDGRLMLLPEETPAGYERLHLLCAGVHAGELQGGRFRPAHALCMAYPANCFRQIIEADAGQLAEYFRGNVFSIPDTALKGWAPVLAQGYPVGWGKASGGAVKNHLPKGLRL